MNSNSAIASRLKCGWPKLIVPVLVTCNVAKVTGPGFKFTVPSFRNAPPIGTVFPVNVMLPVFTILLLASLEKLDCASLIRLPELLQGRLQIEKMSRPAGL